MLAVDIAFLGMAALFFAISVTPAFSQFAAETSELSRFADVAVIAASADARVIDALGSPLTPSGSPGGRWTANEAMLIAGVRGSKGTGLTATAIRRSDGWKLLELVVKTDQGRRHIVVVERTARQLPAQ